MFGRTLGKFSKRASSRAAAVCTVLTPSTALRVRLREVIEPFDGTQGWLIAVFGCHKPAKFSKFWQNRIVALGRVAASDLIDSDRSRIELCGSHFDVSRIPETWKFPSASEFAKHPAMVSLACPEPLEGPNP